MMEKNNNTFCWSRFWTLLKWHFADRWQVILTMFVVLFLLTTGVMLFSSLVGALPSTVSEDSPLLVADKTDKLIALMAISNSSLIVSTFICVILSRVCVNMAKRSGDIAYLMLPSTNLEKWSSRVVYVVVAGLCMCNLAHYLSIGLCEGLGYLLGNAPLRQLYDVCNSWKAVEDVVKVKPTLSLYLFNYTSTFFIVGAFLLGGTYFRRLGWLYTALIVLTTIVVSCFVCGLAISFYYQDEILAIAKLGDRSQAPAMLFKTLDGVFVFLNWLSVAFGVLTIWLSYKVFCHRQLEAYRVKFIR